MGMSPKSGSSSNTRLPSIEPYLTTARHGAHLPKPQYVLMVNGQVPRHEIRQGLLQTARRSSLRRLLEKTAAVASSIPRRAGQGDQLEALLGVPPLSASSKC
jgi:hypothetical protein